MTAILITGGRGQLGSALRRHSWSERVRLFAPARDELDLFDPAAVAAFLSERSVAAIVNAAAFTAVDQAETEIAAAFAANAQIPAVLAEAARQADAALLHVSTDYVFDGSSAQPYDVGDPVNPLNVYGSSKAAGELAALRAPRAAVVRASWLVGRDGTNFVRTMLRLASERSVVRVVADQRGAPTIAADLADALATIALRMATDRSAPAGVFHFANAGATTWRDFAAAIFAEGARRGLSTPRLEAVTTAEYGAAALRPAHSLLSTRRLEQGYGIKPRPWIEGLPGLIGDIIGDDA